MKKQEERSWGFVGIHVRGGSNRAGVFKTRQFKPGGRKLVRGRATENRRQKNGIQKRKFHGDQVGGGLTVSKEKKIRRLRA